ncbi:COG3788 Uncharacterized relative of glutathione S-transferase, MAPEG superfamily [Rhabdaerophilaceae bacterium]
MNNASNPSALSFAASYIGLLILLGVILTARVIAVRRSAQIGIGDGGNHMLTKRMRVHGNYAETAPFLVAILVLLPLLGGREWMVHLIGLTGLVGRILHAIGLGQTSGASFGRVAGMVMTLTALAIGAAMLLVLAWR